MGWQVERVHIILFKDIKIFNATVVVVVSVVVNDLYAGPCGVPKSCGGGVPTSNRDRSGPSLLRSYCYNLF